MLNGTCPHCGGHLTPDNYVYAINLCCDTCPYESQNNPKAEARDE